MEAAKSRERESKAYKAIASVLHIASLHSNPFCAQEFSLILLKSKLLAEHKPNGPVYLCLCSVHCARHAMLSSSVYNVIVSVFVFALVCVCMSVMLAVYGKKSTTFTLRFCLSKAKRSLEKRITNDFALIIVYLLREARFCFNCLATIKTNRLQ